MGEVVWPELLEELVDTVADHASSNIDFIRIRSICKPWRSAVATKKRSAVSGSSSVVTKKRCPERFPTYLPYDTDNNNQFRLLYPTTFIRVSLPSSPKCPSKGWLIKTRQVSESGKKLLCPLTGQPMNPFEKTLDLMKVGVSEILQSYEIHLVSSSAHIVNYQFSEIHQRYNAQYFGEKKRESLEQEYDIHIAHEFSSVVYVEGIVFILNHKKEIWCCKTGEGSDSRWIRIQSEETKDFSDIIVHKRGVYVLDIKGAVWWIKLSDLNIYQYKPLTPMDYYDQFYDREDKRFVEYCGDLCVVCRFYKRDWHSNLKIVRFKVYKMDVEFMRWIEVRSLGDKTLIMAEDRCLTISASEYYGCLKNAIYFMEGKDASVFKLGDGSIITKNCGSGNKKKNMFGCSSSSHQNCFEMFSSPLSQNLEF